MGHDYSPDTTRYDWRRVPRAAWLVLALLAWASLGLMLADRYAHARAEFATRPDTPPDRARADGGSGHAEIDFGGQYALGRMVVEGEGRNLYRRERLREVVRDRFPAGLGSPAMRKGREPSDEANLMHWFVGDDAADPPLGGPLYPPTHACLYAPLTLLLAPQAYHLYQVLSLLAAVLAGLALALAARWKPLVSWPLLTLAILGYPHQQCGLDLAQNQAVTLLILSCGVLARQRGHSLLAGLTWSLLAYKPTWALAFLAVPVLVRDWRMLAGMVAGGACWVLLTLPVVGVNAWFEWLQVGQLAAAEYEVNKNWTGLSRDLGGLFRRLLTDFDASPVTPNPAAGPLGLAAVGVVLGVTAWVCWSRANPGRERFAFAALGAYLACWRFMYYDAAIGALPVILLATTPGRWQLTRVAVGPWRGLVPSLTLGVLALLLAWENLLKPKMLGVTLEFGAWAPNGGRTPGMPAGAPALAADTTVYTPSDTLILLGLWAWWAVKLGSRRVGGVGDRSLGGARTENVKQ